ncbi:MAG: hypothetical protein DRI83_12550, partial [Bacteroidetes bacterium]
MKKMLILSIICLMSNLLWSQWEWQNPKPTGNPLNNLYFTDNNHGWIAGANGTVLKTIDGGNTWDLCQTNTDKDLQEVIFRNSSDGLVVCNDGTILKTNDGGVSWINIETGLDRIYGLKTHLNHAWLLADSGKILHSPNFGYSWNIVYDDPNIQLNGISFVSEDHGWVIGRHLTNSPYRCVLLSTLDGGMSWYSDTLLFEWQVGKDVKFTNTQIGYLTTSWNSLYK